MDALQRHDEKVRDRGRLLLWRLQKHSMAASRPSLRRVGTAVDAVRHNALMLVGRTTWRPPKRPLRWWARRLTFKQRLSVVPAWALSHLAARLARGEMSLLHGAFSRRGLDVFPKRAEHQYAPRFYNASFAKLRSPLDDPEFMRDAQEALGHGRTKLYYDRLHVLYQALHEIARSFPREELRIIEAGAFRGGTAYFLARVAERVAPQRAALWALDTFEGRTEQDVGSVHDGGQTTPSRGGKPYDASYESVADYLSVFPFVTVVKGRIQDVAESLPAHPIHLIHLDMNVYKPTVFGLELAQARLAPGGIVVLDDYSNVSCPGVAKAVEDVLSRDGEHAFTKLVLPTGQCWLVAPGSG
jgi:hypothetical protein